MADFDYSSDALNTLNAFYNCEAVVYVEGDDDVSFWEAISRLAGINTCHIVAAGGVEELDAKTDHIISDNAMVIVARDLDHSPFLTTTITHERIVYTYGYSIENTMYCTHALDRIISKLARSTQSYSDSIEEWYVQFSSDASKLLVLDIANSKYKKSISVFGDNCCRFLNGNNSEKLDNTRIEAFIKSILQYFDVKEIETCNILIQRDGRAIRYLIKGHFITHAALNLVKKRVRQISGRRVTLPLDNFYALAVDSCCTCVGSCEGTQSIVDALRKAIHSVA